MLRVIRAKAGLTATWHSVVERTGAYAKRAGAHWPKYKNKNALNVFKKRSDKKVQNRLERNEKGRNAKGYVSKYTRQYKMQYSMSIH